MKYRNSNSLVVLEMIICSSFFDERKFINHHLEVVKLNLGYVGSIHTGLESLEVNVCNFSCREHGSWNLPLHMDSQVSSL